MRHFLGFGISVKPNHFKIYMDFSKIVVGLFMVLGLIFSWSRYQFFTTRLIFQGRFYFSLTTFYDHGDFLSILVTLFIKKSKSRPCDFLISRTSLFRSWAWFFRSTFYFSLTFNFSFCSITHFYQNQPFFLLKITLKPKIKKYTTTPTPS